MSRAYRANGAYVGMKKRRIAIGTALGCLCCLLCLPLAACGNDAPPPAETEYTITAADGADYSVDAPDTAKAGETVTVTVTSKSILKTVAEVKANDTACTAGGDGAEAD